MGAPKLYEPQIVRPQKKVRLVLPPLHNEQKKIVQPRKPKFSVACCGTKFGKTLSYCIKCVRMLFNATYPIQILWAAPYYQNAKVAFKYLQRLIPPELRRTNNSDLTITLKHNGAMICFKGVNQDPEAVEGELYHHVVVDEASKMKPQAIISIRTTTTATGAQIDIVSTPRGKNWFWDYFKRGLDPKNPDYVAYTFPTSANPYIDPQEIEISRRQMPDRLFRQLYLAQFLADSDVFLGYRDCFYGDELAFDSKDRQFWLDPEAQNKQVVIGVDWAKSIDYTVFVAIDYTEAIPRVVGFFRCQGMQYKQSVRFLQAFCSKFKDVVTVLHDRTGVGEAVDEMLSDTTIPYEGLVFTNDRKSELVTKLMIGVEQKYILMPQWPSATDEFESYEVTTTKTGRLRYAAPEGEHDDIVTAYLLAWEAASDFIDDRLELKMVGDTLDKEDEDDIEELDLQLMEMAAI